MASSVEEMPSGQPTGNGRGPQPYRRPPAASPQDRFRSARRP